MNRAPRLLPPVVLLLLLVLTGCGGSSHGSAAPAGPGSCAYRSAGEAAKPADPPPTTGVATTGSVTFVLTTDQGDVRVAMDRGAAPCTVNSFGSLAAQHFFDGTRCHRLTTSQILVLQCGDPTGTGSGGPGYEFDSETTGRESYTKGVVAMANAGPGTNGSQFFLVYGDSTGLDKTPDYTVFGRMDAASVAVVEKIAAAGQDDSFGSGDGAPRDPAEIVRVRQR